MSRKDKIYQMEKKEEIHYWNFLKTISIFLVVYCHMPLLNASWYNNYTQLITFIAVPLFFMVNGAALFQARFQERKHLRKMLHIFIVTRIWRFVYLVFAGVYGLVELTELSGKQICVYFAGGSISGIPSGPLWFMRVLLACYLIFPILKAAYESERIKKYLWYFCLILIFLILVRQELLLIQEAMVSQHIIKKRDVVSFNFMTRYNPINEWAVIYFILGGLLHQKYYVERRLQRKGIAVISLVCFLTASVYFFAVKGAISGFSGTVFNDFSKYGIDGCYQSIAVFVMTVSLFLFALKVNWKNRLINIACKIIGRNTLGIYYVHYMGAYLLTWYIPYFQQNVGIKCNVLKTLLLILIGLVVNLLVKKIPYLCKMVI